MVPDISINIQQTILASEDLKTSANRIEARVREFSDALQRHMQGPDWEGGMKNVSVAKLTDLVNAFDLLTEKCRKTGVVIRQIAESMDETERKNMSRFVDMGETR
jgi:hypothetical protein